MTGDTFLTLLGLGVVTGASYGLFGLGYALVYGVLGVMNLAYGDVLMISTFACLGVYEASGHAVGAVVAALGLGAVAAGVVDQVAYRPLRFTGDAVAPLVASLGAALVLRNLTSTWFGYENRSFPRLLGVAGPELGTVRLPLPALVAIPGCVAFALGVRRFLDRTRPGSAVLAVAQDLTAARLVGVPVWAAVLGVHAVSGLVAALGGLLYASTFTGLKLSLGWTATVVAFTAAVLGGSTSVLGAAGGGLALGMVHVFLSYAVPGGYREGVAFAVLAAVLVIRPPSETASSRPATT